MTVRLVLALWPCTGVFIFTLDMPNSHSPLRLAFPPYPGARPALTSIGNNAQSKADVIFHEIAERAKQVLFD